ncbi:MAG: hypothetical protein ACJAYU_002729 [Bradymonadia bacterium]|jgi:hypothetical protein
MRTLFIAAVTLTVSAPAFAQHRDPAPLEEGREESAEIATPAGAERVDEEGFNEVDERTDPIQSTEACEIDDMCLGPEEPIIPTGRPM